MSSSSEHLFIRACFQKPVERTPVWMMRQAGRYLPEYRAIRKKVDFTTLYKTPDLAAEVTLQPIDIVGVDAAIIFSDILVIPEAMGMELKFIDGKGPQFPSPLTSEADIRSLKSVDPVEQLPYVQETIRKTRNALNGRAPVIGFSGSPWTLATYMLEGGGSKAFRKIRSLRYNRPDLLIELLEKLTVAVTAYCNAQIEAGAQAIQLFDSWAGLLDKEGFETFALQFNKKVIAGLKREGVPIIYFPKGGMLWLEEAADCGADVISLDWNIPANEATKVVNGRTALQGNLDPANLYATPENIRESVRKMLYGFAESRGHVA
ncbi:MAG: uroporphyrinogen decarboxylase, partial [Calditrichota bacterium]